MTLSHLPRFPIAVVFLLTLTPLGAGAADPPSGKVQFNRDIRPLLSNTCFQCHGPDSVKRKADLRLDMKSDVYDDRGDYRIVVPGKPDDSELYLRLVSEDPEERMPPAKSDRKLTKEQIHVIRRWIEQGAEWQNHWSFITPVRPDLPRVKNLAHIRNAIDALILARLEREGLEPSPAARKTTLIRRVTLDFTGLPTTIAEVNAFLADDSPAAYEKVVDRLLKSPHFGERMAIEWLDAARYADTSGYQNDGPRYMWRWRDWVIEAFNKNQPFDEFTIEQIAGDMLPGATLDQRIATGFNRNHRGNAEGGIIPEEFAIEYVIDRVETTSTVWLGLTMGCGRCHEHKFDPVSQEEFYGIFAYFNNVPENGRAIKEGNSPPFIKAPTRSQQQQLAELDRKLAAAQEHMKSLEPEIARSQQEWEKSFRSEKPIHWAPSDGLVAHYPLNDGVEDATGGAEPGKFSDGEPAYTGGMLGRSGEFDGKRFVDAGDVGGFGYHDKFSFGAWIYPLSGTGTVLSRMTDEARADGWYLRLQDGKLQVNLIKRWLDDSIRIETEKLFRIDKWSHVFVTYDGSRLARGITVYVNGKKQKFSVKLDSINQSFASKEPLRIGGGGGPQDRFHGFIDDVRIYADHLSAADVQAIGTTASIDKIVASKDRTQREAAKLRSYFLRERAPEQILAAGKELSAARRGRLQFYESIPTVMVMEEMSPPRETFVLTRGEYDKPGKKVTRGIPASLPPLPAGAPNNRLGFARWLVDRSNPLTARVTVNRYWQMLFGTGLVKTTEDFGSQGERPSHPELLDWLAVEFMETGWDVKGMLKLMVMSGTYRQASDATPELVERDPENRLLAHGPRFRLPAETVRDQALAVSGLLTERLGGPSVKPYQPPDLWREIATDNEYVRDTGDNLYRRSLYTYWKRTVAPPTMISFDASAREMCSVKRARTNTPLQALTLMNETAFVEAARVLAERVMTQGGNSPENRLTYAFRLATARPPKPAELQILTAGLNKHRQHYREHREAAKELTSVGDRKRNEKLDVAELAAYTAIAGLILNLDETVTKE